jgi:hypothetical protein
VSSSAKKEPRALSAQLFNIILMSRVISIFLVDGQNVQCVLEIQ